MKFKHHKLLLPSNASSVLSKRIKRDKFASQTANSIVYRAENFSHTPLLALRFEPGRRVILPTARELLNRILILGVADLLTVGDRFAKRVVQELEVAADFDDWNPSHFLCTAEMATAVAIGLSWADEHMTGTQRDRISHSLVSKCLYPGFKEFESSSFWTDSKSNWNTVCNCGLILAAIVTAPYAESISDKIQKLCLRSSIHGDLAFGEEGDHIEGPTYWTHALNYLVLRLAALEQLRISVQPNKGIRKSWKYAMDIVGASGNCFNHGDALLKFERPTVLGWIANHYNCNLTAHFQRKSPELAGPLDLIWLSEKPDSAFNGSFNSVEMYPTSGFSVVKKSSPVFSINLFAKYGVNKIAHSHLDLTSFILEIDGLRFISDLGRDNYALHGYFDPNIRYHYLRTSTSGHNCLQEYGKNQSIDAVCVVKNSTQDRNSTRIELKLKDDTKPYIQTRIFTIAENRIVIEDWIEQTGEIAKPISMVWQIFTEAKVSTTGNIAELRLQQQTINLCADSDNFKPWESAEVTTSTGELSAEGYTRVFTQTEFNGDLRGYKVVIEM